jgi:hypothetical protein
VARGFVAVLAATAVATHGFVAWLIAGSVAARSFIAPLAAAAVAARRCVAWLIAGSVAARGFVAVFAASSLAIRRVAAARDSGAAPLGLRKRAPVAAAANPSLKVQAASLHIAWYAARGAVPAWQVRN